MEQWKDIAEYEGLYQVSDQGRIKSTRRRGATGGILKVYLDPDGRPLVRLYLRNKSRNIRVCRIVLETFVGPCPAGLECCHWDDVPTNNKVSNLRWDTRKENRADAKRNGKFDSFCRPIIRSDGVDYESIMYAARCTGIPYSTIWVALNHINRSAGGYDWKYASS